MKLSEKKIAEFKALWKQETGKDITDKEAEEYATDLLELMKLVYYPSTNTTQSKPSHS